MSVKNLYTNNLKSYQNLKVTNISEINTIIGNSNINIVTNGGTVNNITNGFHYSLIGSFIICSFEFIKSTITSGVSGQRNYMEILIATIPAEILPNTDTNLGYTKGVVDGINTNFNVKYLRDLNSFRIELGDLANVPLGNIDIDIKNISCIWFI